MRYTPPPAQRGSPTPLPVSSGAPVSGSRGIRLYARPSMLVNVRGEGTVALEAMQLNLPAGGSEVPVYGALQRLPMRASPSGQRCASNAPAGGIKAYANLPNVHAAVPYCLVVSVGSVIAC